jgi:AraC-like DNA-binding protein
VIYEESEPSPVLAPWIAQHWRFEVEASDGDDFEHVIVPDGTLSISVMQSPGGAPGVAVLAGPSTKAHRVRVRRGIVYFGVRLHPSATGPLLRIDAATLADKIGPVSLFLPAAAKVIDQAITNTGVGQKPAALEGAVQVLAASAEAPDAAITQAIDRLLASHGAGAIHRLAHKCGLSARQFRRKFTAHVGLSPKEFARVRRIRRACLLMLEKEDAQLIGVSHEGGYSDQPHLTREFRDIFGGSPRLIEAYLRQIEHINVRGA